MVTDTLCKREQFHWQLRDFRIGSRLLPFESCAWSSYELSNSYYAVWAVCPNNKLVWIIVSMRWWTLYVIRWTSTNIQQMELIRKLPSKFYGKGTPFFYKFDDWLQCAEDYWVHATLGLLHKVSQRISSIGESVVLWYHKDWTRNVIFRLFLADYELSVCSPAIIAVD